MKKSVSLWLPDAKALLEDSDTEEGQAEGAKVSDPLDCLPITAEAQLKAAKTLIEVEEYNVRKKHSTVSQTSHFYMLGDSKKPGVGASYLLSELCSHLITECLVHYARVNSLVVYFQDK